MTTPDDEPYRGDEEVLEVVRGFESCGLPPAAFNHRAHLVVALCYLLREGDGGALARLRAGVARYVAAHGVNPNLYHETITVFWLRRVRAYVSRAGAGAGLAELANNVLRECGPSRLVFDYYSKGLVDSDAARRGRVEPDLKPLDF
ncbi:MAG TPA: hypothetical protein VF668_22365 [Pyrinomonadaceae bacterium]|jgi:hypothetical protein